MGIECQMGNDKLHIFGYRTWVLRRLVRELASPEIQRDVWIGGLGEHPSSLVEVVCGLLDDINAPEMLTAAAEIGIWPPSLLASLGRLLELLKALPEDLVTDDARAIRHAAWPDVVRVASDVARQLDSFVGRTIEAGPVDDPFDPASGCGEQTR